MKGLGDHERQKDPVSFLSRVRLSVQYNEQSIWIPYLQRNNTVVLGYGQR